MDIIITTTNTIEGFKVLKYLPPITSNIVISGGIFTDLFAGVRDLVGGRSNAYQEKLTEMYNDAINQLKISAEKNGANCVLGVKFDLGEISGKGIQMFMLNAIGTPVIIATEDDYMDKKEELIKQFKEMELERERIKTIKFDKKQETKNRRLKIRETTFLFEKPSHSAKKVIELGAGEIIIEIEHKEGEDKTMWIYAKTSSGLYSGWINAGFLENI
ncbi:MAG: YbjQ family protein [Spirochaetaceae bacterium]|nr:YbjQ family protein [Spirochaetaceae bacterium]